MDWRGARISMGRGSVLRRKSNNTFVVFKSHSCILRFEDINKSFLLNNFHKTFIKETCDRDVLFEGIYLKYNISSSIIEQYEPSQTDKTANDWEVVPILIV